MLLNRSSRPWARLLMRQISQTAFISGHIKLPSSNYFRVYYEKPISAAILAGHRFIMGPSPGIDSISLRYLLDQGVHPSRITIYLAKFERHTLASRVQWFVDLGGNVKVEGSTLTKRDEVMTRDSDYDILRYMSIEEQRHYHGEKYRPRVSGTEKNERRRKALDNQTVSPLPPAEDSPPITSTHPVPIKEHS